MSADEEAYALRRMVGFCAHNTPVHKGVEFLTIWVTINASRQTLHNGLHKNTEKIHVK
jgi:hypothetical protein